jgi:hypothetical protein
MKISNLGRISGLFGLIAGLSTSSSAQSDNQAAPALTSPPQSSAPVNFSPSVRDILKMVDAKVDPTVINAYIKNSTAAYNPTASEIIALKERGVSDDIVTALLQKGAEMRAQLARSMQSTAQPAPLTPQEPVAPAYDATAPYAYPDYADYGFGYPYYGFGYSAYPYYSSFYWNTWYPWAGYSPFYHGYYGHHFYGRYPYYGHYGNRGYPYYGGHSYAIGRGGYYGGRSYAVARNNFGYGGRSGAWAPVRGGFAGRNGGFVARGGFGGGSGMHGGFGGGARGGFSGGHSGGGGGGGSHGGHR